MAHILFASRANRYLLQIQIQFTKDKTNQFEMKFMMAFENLLSDFVIYPNWLIPLWKTEYIQLD